LLHSLSPNYSGIITTEIYTTSKKQYEEKLISNSFRSHIDCRILHRETVHECLIKIYIMFIKKIASALLLAGLTVVSTTALKAQTHASRPHSPSKGKLEQVTTVQGTISQWVYNDDFEYDGLDLNTGNATVFVKFPPHLGQSVRGLGNRITVSGVLKSNKEGVQEIKMLSISGNGQTVHDQKPIRTTAPLQEQFVNGEGRISQLQINKKGEVCGYILDGGVVLRISPRTARQLSQMVRAGSVTGYSGVEKALKPGHARAFDYQVIRCRTISVNGTQYMVK
jgi:hypothetical protein